MALLKRRVPEKRSKSQRAFQQHCVCWDNIVQGLLFSSEYRWWI
jgi:hypothetical protein